MTSATPYSIFEHGNLRRDSVEDANTLHIALAEGFMEADAGWERAESRLSDGEIEPEDEAYFSTEEGVPATNQRARSNAPTAKGNGEYLRRVDEVTRPYHAASPGTTGQEDREYGQTRDEDMETYRSALAAREAWLRMDEARIRSVPSVCRLT